MRNHILKFTLALLFFTCCMGGQGQEQIFKYKQVADRLIKASFDTSIIKTLKCKSFYVEYGNGSSTSYLSYEKFKFEREKLSKITFTYTFFSNSLDCPFSFTFTLNSKKYPLFNNRIFDNVPECVRHAAVCNFISKDSALAIAKNSSIRYLDNVSLSLEQAPQSNAYYWVIEGQPKQSERAVKKKTYSSGYGAGDYRYVNAETGELISRSQFFKNL